MQDLQIKSENITVAMSGGVDSTVTAALLLQGGHRVEGVFLALAQPDLVLQINRVAGIAERLSIPLTVLDLQAEFEREVLTYFRQSYYRGLTPNPCIVCNRTIKFGWLLDKIQEKRPGARLATGHYVRLDRLGEDDRVRLLRGRDPKKDQSYFLCRLTWDQLQHLRFPLGEFTKDQVYELAAGFGFSEFREKQESQDICFLKGTSLPDFLAKRRAEVCRPGPVVTLTGKEIGRHDGICGFTVGQRRGLGIPDATPYYVVALDSLAHRVVVGKEADLWNRRLLVRELHWLRERLPDLSSEFEVKIRYRHAPAPAMLRSTEDGMFEMVFHEPQRAVTPGQFAALYRGDELLGSGEIVMALP